MRVTKGTERLCLSRVSSKEPVSSILFSAEQTVSLFLAYSAYPEIQPEIVIHFVKVY